MCQVLIVVIMDYIPATFLIYIINFFILTNELKDL